MMWPFSSKEETLSQIPEKTMDEAIDELGLVQLNKLGDAIGLAVQKHLDPAHIDGLQDSGGHFGTEFNLSTTVGRLKSLYSREPWVYTTATLIARSLSSIPFVVKDKDTGELEPDHELQAIVDSGNSLNDSLSTNWAGYLDLGLAGNFFRIISEDRKQIWHVPVEFTELRLNPNFKPGETNQQPYDSLQITGSYHGRSLVKTSIPWEQVIHHKLPNPFSPYFGISMYTAASRPILLDRHKNEFEFAFYMRGATNAGVIETTEDITKTRMSRLMATFEQSFTGKRNWWRTLFLPKGAKWINSGLTMSEMQHLEGLRENRRTLLAVLGIPPSMVGIVEDVNRATAEVQESAFWENTIIPLSMFIAAGWNNSHLVKNVFGGQVEVVPDLSGISAVEGSLLKKAEEAEALKEIWVVNELREHIGSKPLKATDPRGNKFVAEIRGGALFGDLNSSIDENLGPDDSEDVPTKTIEIPEGTAGHSHKGQVDAEGNGETVSTSEGHEDHVHKLSGEIRDDGSIVVSVEPGGENNHIHPTVVLESEEAKAARLFRKVKADAVSTQERLERVQTNKFLEEYRKYLALILSQAKEALEQGKGVAATLGFLAQQRAQKYEATALPVLEESMERAFIMAQSNSKNLTIIRTKATKQPQFTATDEQAIQVIKERTADGQRRKLRERSIERFRGFDETTTENIMQIIENGLTQGQTFQEIAKTIEQDYGENYGDQAFTITRTEVLSAVSDGLVWEQETLRQVFSDVEKQWFHIGDVGSNPDARAHHLGFERQGKQEPDHNYVSPQTGKRLKYPRDPNGGASEVVNCRCSMVSTVKDGASSNAVAILEREGL